MSRLMNFLNRARAALQPILLKLRQRLCQHDLEEERIECRSLFVGPWIHTKIKCKKCQLTGVRTEYGTKAKKN